MVTHHDSQKPCEMLMTFIILAFIIWAPARVDCLGALVGSDVPILEHRDRLSCNMDMSL